jgi:hypothetical protein
VRSEWLGVVRAEGRSQLLLELLKEGLGTDDVENVVRKQRKLRFLKNEERDGIGDREKVKLHMVDKLEDSLQDEALRRKRLGRKRSKLEKMLGRKGKNMYKKVVNRVKGLVAKERKKIKDANRKKVREIRIERKKETRFKLPELLKRYEDAKVFSEYEPFRPGDVRGPVIVGDNISLLSRDEVAVLSRGPKFTVRRILDKERFLSELEKAFIKIRWSKRDEEVDDHGKPTVEEKDEEQKRIDEIAELEAVRSRQIFDKDSNTLDFRNHRCTDAKHNTRLILPGPLTTYQEQELEMRRVEWGAVYDKYMEEFTDEGIQEENLTLEEARGLKSLKKRVGEGSIVVVQTDKSSRFAIMTLEEYEEAGRKNTSKDEEVNHDFLMGNQTQVNGHIAMLLKTFMVGATWGHEARQRATMITHSLSIAGQ